VTLAAPKDHGAEARRLVAAAYAGRWRTKQKSRQDARKRADEWLAGVEDETEARLIGEGIRSVAVEAICAQHPTLSPGYVANVVRQLCAGERALSAGWRERLVGLGGAS